MKKTLYILFCVCAMAMLSSCHSTKKLPKGNVGDEPAVETVKVQKEKVRYEAALNNAADFKFLQAKTRYVLDNKSLSGRLNVERGKRLCMTVTVLGIEVARVEASEKTVVIVDKFDKLYTELSISEFAQQLGMQDEMRYEALECLILGRMFVPGSGEAAAKDYKKFTWANLENGVVQAQIEKDKYSLGYNISEDDILLETIVKVVKGGSESVVGCKYTSLQDVEGGKIPANETLIFNALGKDVTASLNLSAPNLSAKSWNSFVPNETYRQVTMQELFEAIKNMKN